MRWIQRNWLNLVMGLLALAILGMGANRLGWLGAHHRVSNGAVLTFDPVKYGNAQRAVAASLMGASGGDVDDQVTLFRQSSAKLRATIQAISGNALVVVKQTVVSGDIEDITDKVLTELGLPTEVPTIDITRTLSDIAPTDYTFSMQAEQQTRRLESQNAKLKAEAAQAKASASSKVVP